MKTLLPIIVCYRSREESAKIVSSVMQFAKYKFNTSSSFINAIDFFNLDKRNIHKLLKENKNYKPHIFLWNDEEILIDTCKKEKIEYSIYTSQLHYELCKFFENNQQKISVFSIDNIPSVDNWKRMSEVMRAAFSETTLENFLITKNIPQLMLEKQDYIGYDVKLVKNEYYTQDEAEAAIKEKFKKTRDNITMIIDDLKNDISVYTEYKDLIDSLLVNL